MDTTAFLSHLASSPAYQNQIVHREIIPPQEVTYGNLEKPLDQALEKALKEMGCFPLFCHQAAAVDIARRGENVVIATPSASGKTLCYNIPVLEELLGNERCFALYLFPTKALAQDQLRNLKGLLSFLPPYMAARARYAVFDGDTPQEQRRQIKKTAHIVFTNPDMLHLGILPNHSSWASLFRGLRYVVIDEVHSYRGIFGSHLGNILRRLKRICSFYGSSPQFICCSATIANPREHAEKLAGLPFQVVLKDGSPHGGKDFIFWNPPLLDKLQGLRRSANSEAAFLFSELVRWGIRTLTFARTRKLTELIYSYSRERLNDPVLAQRIKAYRAGYLSEERRQIERELFEGHLLGAVATTALELGIDIGDLSATVLTGYPGSIASTWQQAGRSGRKKETSLAFLIGLDNPLDQYFMRYPPSFFQKSFEYALTDPYNPYVLKPHLLCAAWELPLSESDDRFWGGSFVPAREQLEKEGKIRRRGERWYLASSLIYPAEKINLRSSGKLYSIVDISQGGRLLETVEYSVALSQIHPGAIYLHQGETYQVVELALAGGIASVVPADVPYYTQAKEITELKVIHTTRKKRVGRTEVCLGEVEVSTTVVGFKRKMQFTEEVIGEEPLDLPSQSFNTIALWFDIPGEAIPLLPPRDFPGGLHAVEHVAVAMLPLFALCDRNDIGGLSTPFHPHTGKAQVFIYDAHTGGAGISEKGFELVEELWQAAQRVVKECPCAEGCPSCVHSPKCGNNNEPLDKGAAQLLLEALLAPAKLVH